jgi:CrcB protein
MEMQLGSPPSMHELKPILLVALGGALGSVVRYKLSGWVFHHTVDWQFPAGTFVVNVVGCLVIGVLAGFAVKEDFFSAETRIFLFSGIMGGFTTFSAFGLETFYLLRRGEIMAAGSNVVLSVVVGLIALWIGFICVPHSGGGFSKHPAPADASKNG